MTTDKKQINNIVIPDAVRNASTGFVLCFPSDCRKYKDLYSALALKSHLNEFIAEIISLTSTENEFLSYVQIVENRKKLNKAFSRSVIYKHTKNLQEAGLLKESYFRREGVRTPVSLLTVQLPLIDTSSIDSSLLSQPKKQNKLSWSEINAAKQKLVTKAFGNNLTTNPNNRGYRDIIFSSMLSKCIRLDATDERKIISTNFNYKDETVDVKTTTLTDGNIAVSSDVRYTMVLTTFCLISLMKHLESTQDVNNKPDNVFVIDLSDVCSYLGIQRSFGNRSTAYSSIKRLYQTNFEINTQTESEFANRFLDGYNESNYRFLTDFKAALEEIDESDDLFSEELQRIIQEERNPRWLSISLWQSSFDNMWNQTVHRYSSNTNTNQINFFVQNPEVVKNKAPLACHLYSHLSSWVGVSGSETKNCTTSDLFEYMIKTSKYQNFMRAILKILNDCRKPESEEISYDTKAFTVNFYGFIISGKPYSESQREKDNSRKGFNLQFKRDINDPYIGNKSRHNTLRKSKALSDSLRELGKNPNDIDIPPAKLF